MREVPAVQETDRLALEKIAEKLFWWKTPGEALSSPGRFLAQVMTLGTLEDVQTVQRVFGREAFRDVLHNPPPGVFDARSWNYWHVIFHLPVPPLPERKFE
jgi:hypothetical protein